MPSKRAGELAVAVGARASALHPSSAEVLERGGIAAFPDPGAEAWFSTTRTVLSDASAPSPSTGRSSPRRSTPPRQTATRRDAAAPHAAELLGARQRRSRRESALEPLGAGRTPITVTWLVASDAVEARDYALDRLLPFWQLTSEQDWEICERQQRGVRSSGFRPGPFAEDAEENLEPFLTWYARRLADQH